MTGARPVFADVDPERLTIDPERIRAAIGPRTRAILPVHLYGQAADMAAIERIAAEHHLAIVEDCCQAHLGTADGRPVGTIGVAGAFSFYPTKNLGALGDGGAIVTNDRALADRSSGCATAGRPIATITRRRASIPGWTRCRRRFCARGCRVCARGPNAGAHWRRGIASGWPARRSSFRRSATADTCTICSSCEAGSDRNCSVQLLDRGIETLVHYPMAIPRQPAMRGDASGGLSGRGARLRRSSVAAAPSSAA